jgi:glyoxylase-like metal-dependent hydrolase (beta-lactamase superfamily II)/rhodanese-related sulfurtransferase
MSVHAIVDEGLGNSSYLADLGDGGALVVDPERDPRPYLNELAQRNLEPRFVVETHLHADFVSGGRELVGAGAELWAPAESALSYPHRGLHDGDAVDLGGLELRVIASPGHTPEHLSYLLQDGSTPIGLFSGGTLMTGGVARTDLLTSDQTEPLARAAYRSITERIFTLPDDLPVYPTHGAGSFCSVGSATARITTIGTEKQTNPLFFDDPTEDTFVERLLAGYGTFPPYFLELREVNRRGPRVYGTLPPPLPQLTVAETEAALAQGAELVDVRNLEAFANGHVPGAISNPWRSQFATWLGWVVPRDQPIVYVADDAVDRQDLVWAAFTVGFENIVGELAGGVEAWTEAGRRLSRIPLTDRSPDRDRTILDVRQRSEYRSGHLPDSVHLELGAVAQAPDDLPDSRILVHCGHGERAMTAASILARSGHPDVAVLKGGPSRLGELVTEP